MQREQTLEDKERLTRSALMRRVRQRGTHIERQVADALRRLGVHPELNTTDLPGTPDVVLRQYNIAFFVHGCFWHFHKLGRCKLSKVPATNSEFWRTKLLGNRQRDLRKKAALRRMGWLVLVVWQCQLQREINVVESLLRKNNVRLP